MLHVYVCLFCQISELTKMSCRTLFRLRRRRDVKYVLPLLLLQGCAGLSFYGRSALVTKTQQTLFFIYLQNKHIHVVLFVSVDMLHTTKVSMYYKWTLNRCIRNTCFRIKNTLVNCNIYVRYADIWYYLLFNSCFNLFFIHMALYMHGSTYF